MTARGTFDVKMSPQPPDDGSGGSFGRFFLDKTFHGDLEATSKGQMLSSGDPSSGSGAYVALELVTGTLSGKQGSFVLVHRGTMRGGEYRLDVSTVPGSGIGDLAGIDGTMTILIEGSKHSYVFSYTLPRPA